MRSNDRLVCADCIAPAVIFGAVLAVDARCKQHWRSALRTIAFESVEYLCGVRGFRFALVASAYHLENDRPLQTCEVVIEAGQAVYAASVQVCGVD